MNKSVLYPRTTATRTVISLNGMWDFWFEGLAKTRIPVPASFQDLFTDKETREYVGDVWYETTVFIPSDWRGKMVGVRFAGAAHRAVVYMNGTEVCGHEGGFLPFVADITDTVVYGADNVLTVKLNNELSEYTLPVGRTDATPAGKKISRPYFDFFNYSGLQREASLVATPKTAISDYAVTYKIDGETATVFYNVKTTEPGRVSVKLFDESNAPVAEADGENGRLNVHNPRLWNVRNAYLYKIIITLYIDGNVTDVYCDYIGIRTVEVVGERILINGKPVYLKGFGKHEDSDTFGRGYNPAVLKRDFELLKWSNANSVRTSHYPYAEEFYQMADREGILVIDETPAVGMMNSTMNFMDAVTGKKTAFFGKETTPRLLENHLRVIEDLINRDKHHPSVIAWCLANEPETSDEDARPYFEKVFAFARTLDASRPMTYTSIMSATPDKCKCYDLCDFICLNRYYGWYVFGGAEIGTAEIALRRELEQWKAKGLNRPFIFTEYGADTAEGLHKLPSVMWSEEYQTEFLEMSHRVFDDYDFVQGEQVWAFADFATGEAILRVGGNRKGVFTRDRQPKAAARLLRKRWEEKV